MQGPVRLGQQIVAAEGGVPLRHSGENRLSCVGQDRIAQIVGAQQRQVVATAEAGHPRDLLVTNVADGPLPPPVGQLGERGVGLGGPGGEGGPLGQVDLFDRGW